jgi:uncharacterized protein
MEFEWDDNKAALNKAKHDLSFLDAIQVFQDPFCLLMDTSRDENQEQRMKAIGLVEQGLVTVVYTNRDRKIRVISARRSNKPEERTYGNR